MDTKIFMDFIVTHQETIHKIKDEACTIHQEVNQTYDGKPYAVHIKAVANEAMKYIWQVCDDENDIIPIIFGAYFHDTIEDARLTYNDVMKIAKKYMSDEQAYTATEIVYALTNEKGRNRAERANDKYYEGIRTTPYAPFIKACDRYANFVYSSYNSERMYKCYKKEMDAFIKHISSDTDDKRYQVPQMLLHWMLFSQE